MKKYCAVTLSAFLLALILTSCSPVANITNTAAANASEESVIQTETASPKTEEILRASADYPKGIAFENYDERQKLRENNPVDDSFITSINRFSYNTAFAILSGTDGNVCCSPLSLYFALAFAGTGAAGDTQAEIFSLLGVSDAAELSKQCGNYYRSYYVDNEISKLKIANSLWLDDMVKGETLKYKDFFINNAVQNFYASLYSADFSDESTGEAMTRWISDNTNGNPAPDLDLDPDSDQIMSIINTIYYCDEWTDRFDADNTAEGTFTLENGTGVTCDFMNMTMDSHAFKKGDGYTHSALSLKNNTSMVIILPDEGVSVNELLDTPEKIQTIFTSGDLTYGEVVWSVPKFSYNSSFKFKTVLQKLGIKSAFEMDADFTGITDHMAYISDVTQQTHIAINENGVEASAFTSITFYGAAVPDGRAEMILDRPFIYGIIDSNGTLLFAGICENPRT